MSEARFPPTRRCPARAYSEHQSPRRIIPSQCRLAKAGVLCDASLMGKKNLRVVKWLGTTPAVAVCTACNREFSVPVGSLSRVAEAQEYLRMQFAEHRCAALPTTSDPASNPAKEMPDD